ncbi:unnamed protein product [Dovyalis caffra]|uniref:Uncharacterized protein n=1 Tax=Dovyalis caffra TaxID=77055 RepID=A0AAV1RBJ6_9ROSI|nr:unnamed protein product [Dovyalis caffra]
MQEVQEEVRRILQKASSKKRTRSEIQALTTKLVHPRKPKTPKTEENKEEILRHTLKKNNRGGGNGGGELKQTEVMERERKRKRVAEN